MNNDYICELTDEVMKKILYVLALLLTVSSSLRAQEYPRHEWRIGWGDMMYEKAVFYNTAEKYNYHRNGHFFAEYQYGILPWFGAGMKVDFSNVNWNSLHDDANHYFNNFCIIPEARFTYLRDGLFTMYSGIGAGLLINGGTEKDYLDRKTVCAPVIDLTAVSCSVQWGKGAASHWFTTVELGGLISLNNKREVFMLGSRVISISIGYRL